MSIKCEIVTAEKTVFSEDVDYVSLPGLEGQMGILPNHTPLLTVLRFGEVYVKKDGEESFFAVGGGFAEVQPDKVIILADSADRADEIDFARAQEARAHAEKLMAEGVPEDADMYKQIETDLRIAQLQLDVANRRGMNTRGRTAPPQFGE